MNSVFQQGTLKRWNDDKGFGFIASAHGGADIFIHISALGKTARRPLAGDTIIYQIHIDNDGKAKAVNAKIEGVTEIRPTATTASRNRTKKRTNSKWSLILTAIALAALIGLLADDKFYISDEPGDYSTPLDTEEENGTHYSCQGKTRCSEMESCAEAKFYLRNCPDTKMDGDGDGIPCEGQLCGH